MVKNKKLSKKKEKKEKDEKKRPRFDIHSEAMKSVWGVFFIILAFLTVLSFLDRAGTAGRIFNHFSEIIFGWGRYAIPASFIIGSVVLFSSWKRNSYVPLLIGGFLFFSGVLGSLHILLGETLKGGGYFGYAAALPFVAPFGKIASMGIFFGFIMASIIISFNVKIGKIIRDLKERKKLKEETSNGSKLYDNSKEEIKVKTWKDEEESPSENRKSQILSLREISQREKNSKQTAVQDVKEEEKSEKMGVGAFEPKVSARARVSDFRLPPTELLEKETGKPSSGDIVANANIIKRTLQNFGIEVEMGEVNVGPTVTQFTLKPAEGVKLARILALNNDLSLALAAHPIRIEAPIPGRSLVGIEIPNKGFTIVRLKNLMESEVFQKRSNNLALTLGRDVSGLGVFANLAKMPHLLIAGSTGSGKTICLNTVILSLLFQNSPATVKFMLIDPKRVEFQVYSDIPHLLAPVVVDTQKAVNALKWAVSEMERRFVVLSQVKARDIASFNSNKKVMEEQGPLPYIVIVIDELADLMAARGKEMEALVVRLAQMARAVGIHLVLATQRPSVEVITGLIKANITSRIAFQVASQVDSRTVLDMAGAEKLLGNGDMLYLAGDASKPRRVQGAFVTEKEIRRVADYLREEEQRLHPTNINEAEEVDAGLGSAYPAGPPTDRAGRQGSAVFSEQVDFEGIDGGSDDELYEEAKKLVIQAQKASSSLLQRRLRVGYARAARLIDMLEEREVVGPQDGAKPRDVYVGSEKREEDDGYHAL